MAKMTITLAVTGQAFVPGDAIAASVDIGTGRDDRLRALRFELGYRNTYYERTQRAATDGSGTRETKASDMITVAAHEIPADDPAMTGGSGTFQATFVVPEDVPASLPRWIEWHVKATLDRRMRRDPRETVPVTILAAPGGLPERAQSLQVCSDDTCEMRLELPSRAVRVGETLAGVLHVEPRAAFEARSVRVDLEWRMHHEDAIERELGEVQVRLADRVTFEPGVAREFPFEITVPADGAPSLRAEHSAVRWHLKGICDRTLRGDYRVSAELVVFNAPS